MTNRDGVGVVIGRFQVANLHEGHLSLLNEANKHAKLAAFIGVNPSRLGVKADPLDYPTREQMLKEAFPNAQVFEIVDHVSDVLWSRELDRRLHALYPRDKVTLYCGRDSFKSHYFGKFLVTEIDNISHVTGTDLRNIDGQEVENHSSFRKGCIYSAYNRWDPIYPCVDVACVKGDASKPETLKVLVGSRFEEEGAKRFPGGHVDPTDESDMIAAVRELTEETGVEATNLQYLWSGKIKSWGDKPGAGTKRTTFFIAEYVHGPAVGNDDLDRVEWIYISELMSYKWADDHKKLASILMDKTHQSTKLSLTVDGTVKVNL